MRGHLRKINLEKNTQVGHSYNLKSTGYSLVVQLLYDNHLYVGSSGIVSAHNPQDYTLIWKNELKGYGIDCGMTLVPYRTSVTQTPTILVGFNGHVVSLHAHSGVIQWKLPISNANDFVSLILFGQLVVAGSSGKLLVIHGDTGNVLAKDDLPGYGYNDICLASEEHPFDQQSSNLNMMRDIKDKSSAAV